MPPVRTRGWGICLLLLLALACGDANVISSPPPGLEGATVVYDSATLATLPALDSHLVWRVGQDSSGGSETFQEINGIAATDSAVFVLDLGSGVHQYSHDGRLLRRFAPRGEGPAELANPRSIAVGGDTIFVLDTELKLFDGRGEHRGQINSPSHEYAKASRIAWTDSGIALQRRWFAPRRGGPPGQDGDRERKDSLLVQIQRFSSDSIIRYSTRAFAAPTYQMSMGFGPPLLMEDVRVTVARDGRLLLPHPEHFVIDVWTAAGALSDRVIGQVPRIPASDADFDDLVELMRTVRASYSDPVRLRRLGRDAENDPRAKYRPALGELLVSETGEILVERRDLGESPFNPYNARARRVWLLIDAEWKPLGYVTLPGRFRPRVLLKCSIFGFETDEFDAPLAARYDIDAAGNLPCSNDEI